MLFRRPTFNENFTAELYKSLPNAPGEWGTLPVTFKYRFFQVCAGAERHRPGEGRDH